MQKNIFANQQTEKQNTKTSSEKNQNPKLKSKNSKKSQNNNKSSTNQIPVYKSLDAYFTPISNSNPTQKLTEQKQNENFQSDISDQVQVQKPSIKRTRRRLKYNYINSSDEEEESKEDLNLGDSHFKKHKQIDESAQGNNTSIDSKTLNNQTKIKCSNCFFENEFSMENEKKTILKCEVCEDVLLKPSEDYKTTKIPNTNSQDLSVNTKKNSLSKKTTTKSKNSGSSKQYPGKASNAGMLPPKFGQIEIPVGAPNCLEGFRFVITGVLDSLEREQASDLIRKYGGAVTSAVSGLTSFLVAGSDPGKSKLDKASAKKVEVIDEARLLDLIRQSNTADSKNNSVKSLSSPIKKPLKELPVKRFTPQKPALVKPSLTESLPEDLSKANKDRSRSCLQSDKYRPEAMKDLIGNEANFKRIVSFLHTFHSNNFKTQKAASSKKSILISGPPGIGKTSGIRVISKQYGQDLIEMNASDARSKKLLEQHLAIGICNEDLFQMTDKKSTQKKKVTNSDSIDQRMKRLIIMDEVDGMSAGDRGGIAELIKLIRQSRFPIICICNDRQSPKIRNLANYCVDLRFRRPTAHQIVPRILGIAKLEKFDIDHQTIEKICESVRGDIRQILNLIQLWVLDTKNKRENLKSSLDYDDTLKRLLIAKKDFEIGVQDSIPQLFSARSLSLSVRTSLSSLNDSSPLLQYHRSFLNDRINLYFVDQSLVPLMIQENYLPSYSNYGPKGKSEAKLLDIVSQAADLISTGDLIDTKIRQLQDYSMLPMHAVLSSVYPAYLIGSCREFGVNAGVGRLQFPSWLGKNSSYSKNRRLLLDLSLHIRKRSSISSLSSGGGKDLVDEYVDCLRRRLLEPLIKFEKEGIDSVIEIMNEYGLNRDDQDLISTLANGFDIKSSKFRNKYFYSPNQISTTVRSAFTRKFNKQAREFWSTDKAKFERTNRVISYNNENEDEMNYDDNDSSISDNDIDKHPQKAKKLSSNSKINLIPAKNQTKKTSSAKTLKRTKPQKKSNLSNKRPKK